MEGVFNNLQLCFPVGGDKMKSRWLTVVITALIFSISLSGDDRSPELKECQTIVSQIEKTIKDINNKLNTLNKKIETQRARITELSQNYDKWGKPVDKLRAELKDLEIDLEKEKKRSGGLVTSGTSLNKLVGFLNGTNPKVTNLKKKIKSKQEDIKKKKREAEQKLPKDYLELVDLRAALKKLNIDQEKLENNQKNLNWRLADKNDDLRRKRKECAALEERLLQTGGGKTGSSEGTVIFIGSVQIPTPKSGMDIPLLLIDIPPDWPNTLEFYPLLQISPSDPRTKAYYTNLRRDFGDAIKDDKAGPSPSIDSLFEGSSKEYGKLLDVSEKAGWKGSPITHYQGPYLVRVACAGLTRYRYHFVGPDVQSSYGGIHFFGLQARKHKVKVRIAAGSGERYEAQFEVVVKYEKQMGRITNPEADKNHVYREGEGKTIEVDLAYLKKQFEKMWVLQLKTRAQTQGGSSLRRDTLKRNFEYVHSSIGLMRDKPGCTAADIDPLLSKGAGAVSLLLSEFGSEQADYVPWMQLQKFALLCKHAGTSGAFGVLSPLAQQAASIAPPNRQSSVANTFVCLGDIALTLGEFDKAVENLNKALEFKKRADKYFDLDKEKAGVPGVDQLKALLKIIERK
jgi:peptidoglycan hydrolase CwlO-like protein